MAFWSFITVADGFCRTGVGEHWLCFAFMLLLVSSLLAECVYRCGFALSFALGVGLFWCDMDMMVTGQYLISFSETCVRTCEL